MPRVRRTTLVLAAALCLAAAPLAAKVTENFDRTFELAAGGSVAVANVNGSIDIKASDGDRVVLHAVKTADNDRGLQSVTIDIDSSPSAQDGKIERLWIETKHSKASWLRWGNNPQVAYELTVPRGAAVEATSVNGAVTVEGVQGGIAAETVNGAVKINGAGGAVEAKTVNGAVKINGAGGAVEAKTVNGAVQAGIADTPAGSSYSFQAVNGSLQVALPADVSGKFQAKTLHGAIETDFPLEVRKAKHWGKKSIDAQLGAGDARYSFSTVNGSIKILKN